MDKIKTVLPSVVLFVLIAGLVHAHIAGRLERDKNDALDGVKFLLERQAGEVRKELVALVQAAQLMAAGVRLCDGRPSMPAGPMAEALVRTFGSVDRIALAPGGEISFIYPSPWTDHGKGKKLLEDETRGLALRDSALLGQGFVSGPHDADGFRFFAAQVPVHTGQSGEVFWGFTLAAAEVEALCRRAGLSQLPAQGYRYRLEKRGPAPGEVTLVAGRKDSIENGLTSLASAPGIELTLVIGLDSALPTLGSYRESYVLGLLLAAGLSLALRYILRQPARLRALVDRQTDRLRRVNKRFAAEIRRRRQIAKDLEASIELSRGLFDDTPAVKLLVDPSSLSVVETNAAAEGFLGWTRQELTGMPVAAFSMSGPEEVGRRVAQAMRGELGFFTSRYKLAGGEVRDVEIFCAPVNRLGARLLQFVVQDVTGRENARRELRASQSRLESVLSAVECALVELDSAGTIRAVNPAFVQMFGLEADQAVGRNFLEVMHPDDHPACVQTHSSIMAGSLERCCLLIRFLRPGGEVFWGSVCKGAVRGHAGAPTGCVAAVTDVTALMDAKKAAEEADKAKGRFLANISHEIRSPMNAVMGLTELTLRTRLDPQQRSNLEKSLEAGRALVKVIEAILDYASLDSGHIQLVREEFDPAGTIEAVRRRFEEKARAKGLAFRVELGQGLPARVLGDPMRLEQVLANLASNAIKFTRAGEVRLSAWAQDADGARARLVFTVSDTGRGMDPEQIEQLFQPFVQGESEMSKLAGGPGLGLSIARKLTDLMGGRLTAASVKRSGSTFRLEVDLPVAREAGSLRQAGDELAELVAGMAGMRVLVVDDNELGRHTAMEMLRLGGIEPDGAESGPQALSMLAVQHYDAVLLDIQMPGMDGFEVMAAMRETMDGRLPPVIAVSGHARNQDRIRCVEAGMSCHVAKPYSPETLFAALKQHVRSEGAAAAPVGLDAQRALGLLLGNRELYGRLLKGFVREYADCGSRMSELVAAGNRQAAVALAHSIKGLAANLGGEKLKAASLGLELALGENGLSSVDRHLEAFGACLEEFVTLAGETGSRLVSDN